MRDDRLLLAAFLGALSTIPGEIFTRISIYLGFGRFSIYELASFTVTIDRPSVVMGFIVDALAGSFIAFIFCVILDKLGSEHTIIKVVFGSLLSWYVCETIFTAIIEGRFIDVRPMNDYYNNILGSLIFGLVLGLLFRRYLFKRADEAR